ncbi:hypothetical protein [Leisingera sp. S232]|uniref:hypothetical protein n=1 Tax=Leisingera sp. S232 TaxID=3415132 RepID=UPI003C7AA99C
MTHDDAIAGNLAALGARQTVFRDGKRVISNGCFPPPLPAILQEIATTVLQRQLCFHAGDSHLALVVSERRLMSLVSASSDLAEAQPLIGTALSHDQPEVLEAVAAAMVRLAQMEQPVLVETGFAAAAADSGLGSLGLPLTMLEEIMDLDPAEQERPMAFFIDASAELYAACLLHSGGAWMGAAADQAVLTKLQQIAEVQWERFQASFAKHAGPLETPRLVSLGPVLEGGLCVSVVWAGGECALFAHSQDDLAALHGMWQRVFTL